MQSLQEQYSSSKVIFFLPMFVLYKWSIVYRAPLKSHSSLFIVALFNTRKSCGLSHLVLVRHFRGPLQLWNKTPCKKVTPLKNPEHALSWMLQRAQEREVRQNWFLPHPGRKCVVWIWPKNVNFCEEQLQHCYLGQWQAPPTTPTSSGRWLSLVCSFTPLQVQNAALDRKRFVVLVSQPG